MNKNWSLILCGCAALLASGCGPSLPVERSANLARAERIREEIDAGGVTVAAAPVLVEPQGWATLSGTFKITGTPPKEDPVAVSGGDAGYCSSGGSPPVAGIIQVGGDGGLGNVLVFLSTTTPTDDPKWQHPDYDAEKTAKRQDPFDQKNCIFLSRIYALQATQTIIVKNSDTVGHNSNIQPKPPAKPANISLPGGGTAEYSPGFPTSDPFEVSCSIHPWMRTWMISRPNPYYAVTDKDGKFEIKNVPAAAGLKLEFRAWHERPKFIQTVSVDGTPATWKKGRFEVELTPGETKTMEVTLDAGLLK